MTKITRAQAACGWELDELLGKAVPYALATPALGNPTLHTFVNGLILSTNIIASIWQHIPTGLHADWGQLIDVDEGNALSNECDIIIYQGRAFRLIENRCIRYALVDKKKAKVVIQVKTGIESVDADDRAYAENMLQHVSELWYIAQNCHAVSEVRAKKIGADLAKAGYGLFCYFLRWNKEVVDIAYDSYFQLVRRIEKIN